MIGEGKGPSWIWERGTIALGRGRRGGLGCEKDHRVGREGWLSERLDNGRMPSLIRSPRTGKLTPTVKEEKVCRKGPTGEWPAYWYREGTR